MSKKLTDAVVNAAKAGDHADGVVPGLILRVRGSGARSYALVARFPGSSNPTRRTLGKVGALSLKEAREKAREWHALVARGIDPAAEVERKLAEADRKRRDTVAALAEAYIASAVIGPDPDKPRMRGWQRTVHNIRDIIVPLFGERPIADLTPAEVSTALREIETLGTDRALVKLKVRKELLRPNRKSAPAPSQARNLFVYLDGMLRWAAATGDYGIDFSPLARVSKAKRFGPAPKRTRYLSEVEIGSAWRASGKLKPPYRQMYRMLMLTGLRLSEVREASWDEFDPELTQWTIPADRMKGRNETAQEHVVPITAHMRAVLKEIPRGLRGPFVFSVNLGATPICERGDFKRWLDEAMAHDQRVFRIEHFTNHDLRRTLRTLGRKLGIDADIGEAMLAHRRAGISGVYDHYDRLDERRDAHVLWGEFLLDCERKANKVTALRGRAAEAR